MKIIKISQELPNYYNIETASNPNTPPEVLSEVLRRGKNDVVSQYAAKNPNTPPQALSEVLRRGNDDGVSQYAARNPNAPLEALSEVLRRGLNDEVSWNAANNPNTPPQALSEVLRRGKDDGVSRCAVRNSNTPSEVLSEILRRGKNDDVSCYATQNPNTPPEVLIEVLRRGKNDAVSRWAALSPNTPPEAVELWKISIDKSIDFNKYLNDLIQSNDTIKIINTLKYIDLNIVDETIVENYIHTAFQNTDTRNELLINLPKTFFDKVAMTEENRKIVEEYFGKGIKDTKPSIFEDIYAKNISWYKISQEFKKVENLSGLINPNNKFLPSIGSHALTLVRYYPKMKHSVENALNVGFIWVMYNDNTLSLEFDINRYQYAIEWANRQAEQFPDDIKYLNFTIYKNNKVYKSFQRTV